MLTRFNVGGTSRYFEEFFKHANSREFEYSFIIGKCASNEIEFDLSKLRGVEIIRIPSMQRKINLLQDFVTFFSLIKIFKKMKPDIIHTHTSKAGLIGRVSSLLSGKPIVLVHSYHGNIFEEYFSNIVSRCYILIESALSRFTDLFIAISSQIRDEIQNLGIGENKNWDVINLGISLDKIQEHSYKANKKITSLLWVGRFEAIKNPMLALEALQLINTKYPVHLTMVGDGTLLPKVKDYAESENLPVTFTGWQETPFLKYPESDFLFVTSKSEGLGYVILEAALAGIPIISTEVGGIKDFVVDNLTGFFAKQNGTSFFEAFESAYRDPLKIAGVTKNARELLLSNFSSKSMVKKYEDAYKRTLASNIK